MSVLRSAECGLDLLQDGAGGGSEPVAVVAVQMVVRGGHAGQAAEGGDEDVEALGVGVEEEVDTLAEEGDLAVEVGGIQSEGDLVLAEAGAGQGAAVEAGLLGVLVAGLGAGLTPGGPWRGGPLRRVVRGGRG